MEGAEAGNSLGCVAVVGLAHAARRGAALVHEVDVLLRAVVSAETRPAPRLPELRVLAAGRVRALAVAQVLVPRLAVLRARHPLPAHRSKNRLLFAPCSLALPRPAKLLPCQRVQAECILGGGTPGVRGRGI